MKITPFAQTPRWAKLAVLAVAMAAGNFPAELSAQQPAADAKLSLRITDAAGVSHTPAFVVYEAGGIRYGQPELRVGDIRDLPKFIQLMRTGSDPVSTYLRSQLYPKGLPPEATGLNDDEQDAANDAFVDALNKVLASTVLFDSTRFAGVKRTPDLLAQAALIQQMGDHTTMVQIKTFNRICLEAAYPGLVVRCSPLFVGDEANPEVVVPAGEYWLVPTGNEKLLRRVTVKPGETLNAASPAPNTLWLTIKPTTKEPPQLLLIQLKPAAERRALIGAYRYSAYFGVLRPGVSDTDREAALDMARREFVQRTSTPLDVKGLPEAEQNRRYYFFNQALNNALRILALAGDASDAALIASAKTGDIYARSTRAVAIAYLESRLGRLTRGELAARLKGSDPDWAVVAAMQFHLYGLPQGDAILRAALQNPALKTSIGSWLPPYVGDDGSPAMVEAVRANFALENAPPVDNGTNSRIWPAARYLLANGTKEDLARIGAVTWDWGQGGDLIPQLADPLPLIRVMAKNSALLMMSNYETYFRSNPTTAGALASSIETEIFAAAAPGATIAADREPGFRALNTYDGYVSFCRPTARAAQLYFNHTIPNQLMQWLPAPWRADELFDSLYKGTLLLNWQYQFDYLPDTVFMAELAKRDTSMGKFDGEDLFIAAHRLCSHVFKYDGDHYGDGIERRPIALQDQEKQGAILGVLELHPKLDGKKLTLDFRFRLVPHYNVGSFIDFNEGDKTKWAHHKYVIDGGKQLIEKISLRVGQRTLPLTDLGSKDGGAFLAEAQIDQTSLDGVLADVDIQFFDQHYTATFDLFASDYAKSLRRAGSK